MKPQLSRFPTWGRGRLGKAVQKGRGEADRERGEGGSERKEPEDKRALASANTTEWLKQ